MVLHPSTSPFFSFPGGDDLRRLPPFHDLPLDEDFSGRMDSSCAICQRRKFLSLGKAAVLFPLLDTDDFILSFL